MSSVVDRILMGTRAADLPIGPPTPFGLVVNVGTAKTIGVMIPQSILGPVDRRIE